MDFIEVVCELSKIGYDASTIREDDYLHKNLNKKYRCGLTPLLIACDTYSFLRNFDAIGHLFLYEQFGTPIDVTAVDDMGENAYFKVLRHLSSPCTPHVFRCLELLFACRVPLILCNNLGTTLLDLLAGRRGCVGGKALSEVLSCLVEKGKMVFDNKEARIFQGIISETELQRLVHVTRMRRRLPLVCLFERHQIRVRENE